jgi:histidine racemase
MMGGEFCINALRSLWFWIYKTLWNTKFKLESSGTNKIFPVQIETRVSIHLPKDYLVNKIENWLMLVELEWISHFVKNIAKIDWDEQKFKRLFYRLLKKHSLIIKNQPAIGLILIDEFNKIYPLIFVREINSFIFESACGSGTLATFIAKEKKINTFIQPSNYIYLVEEREDCFTLKSIVEKFNDD